MWWCPTLCHNLTTTTASERCVVVAAFERELLDCVDAWRVRQGRVGAGVVDVRTVHDPVVCVAACAIDGDGRIVIHAESNFIAHEACNAGLQQYELLEIAVVQGKLPNLLAGYRPGLLSRSGLDRSIFRRDFHVFADLPGM